MKATEANFLGFLKNSLQFVIPIYQRTYNWRERECRQLWGDILRTGSDQAIPSHFTGAIVYIDPGIYQVTRQPSLLVIDGQQRLTTVMLILEALARRVGESEPVEGFSARRLRNYYLLNPEEKGEQHFKLLLTQTDKQSLLAIVQQKPEPVASSIRIAENFAFFQKQIRNLETNELTELCKGLAKLTIVDIALSRDHDNPQLIFESMNSTGRELSQADLIRNFVLMGLDSDRQTRLYENYWRPMEVAFGQEAYATDFDWFMRHYLTVKMGDIPRVHAVYEDFKHHARSPEIESVGVDAHVADIHTYAGYYCAMALGKETGSDLASVFRDLCELKVDVAYPFLLELYNDYAQGLLHKSDLVSAVRLVESYVFRRAVCAIPTNSLNKTFATFGRALKKERYIESMRAHFLTLPSYRRFPNNEEFKRELSTRDLYNFARCSYFLRRLENHDHKEYALVDEYTVEHIMPQNPDLCSSWRNALGPEWQQIQEKWLHTLGNLTLTGYNSEYGDRPFPKKRDMPGGFKDSPLRLNIGLRDLETWNESTIQQRAKQLAAKAVQVWVAPFLPDEILATYRDKRESSVNYTFTDHQHLAVGSPMRLVFDNFRKEVLALNSGITEKVLSRYIAYKAETNFVDVKPQKNNLQLYLNLRYHELYDPRGLAKDVTNLGHSGKGDAQVTLSAVEELQYVLGLVRQAFEKQM